MIAWPKCLFLLDVIWQMWHLQCQTAKPAKKTRTSLGLARSGNAGVQPCKTIGCSQDIKAGLYVPYLMCSVGRTSRSLPRHLPQNVACLMPKSFLTAKAFNAHQIEADFNVVAQVHQPGGPDVAVVAYHSVDPLYHPVVADDLRRK